MHLQDSDRKVIWTRILEENQQGFIQLNVVKTGRYGIILLKRDTSIDAIHKTTNPSFYQEAIENNNDLYYHPNLNSFMGNIGICLSYVDIEQRRFHPHHKSSQYDNPPILSDNNF